MSKTSKKNRRLLRAVEPLESRRMLAIVSPVELSGLAGGGGATGSVFRGENPADFLGTRVDDTGDVNNDGYDDFVLSVSDADPNGSQSGKAYIIFGTPDGMPAIGDIGALDGTNGFVINGLAEEDLVGFDAGRLGDFNGDGIHDIVISATGADGNGENTGQALVIYGSTATFPASMTPDMLDGSNGFRVNGEMLNDFAGFAVDGAGDVNGDGLEDLFVGAHLSVPNNVNGAGTGYIIYGTRIQTPADVFLSSLDGTLGFKIIGENELDFAGYSVSTAGDLNGDGLDDMILGAIQSDPNNREDSGQVYVIFANRFGQPANLELSTLNGTNGFKITGDQSDDNLGLYANELGDFNGDGLDDFVLGTNEASSNGFSRSGDAYVVFGSTSYPAEIGAGEIAGNYGLFFGGVDVNDRLGRVDAAGDVNGDGYDDLILGAVGASGTNNALITSGESYVIFGVPTGLEAGLDLSSLNGLNGFALHGVSFGDQSGFSVSSAGDVNGDGFDDIVIGARLADPGGVQTGEAYLFYGGDHSDAVTHLGTDANDTLTGDGGANVIVGGLGDDQLIGILGADTLRGGQGNDELLIDGDDFFRIDGGSGHDILGWRGTGAALDLTTIPDNRIQDIEQVDLIGISSRLIVDQLDVLNLSSTTNTLLVTGDSNDSVEIDSDWVETGTDVINGETFRVFEFGNAILKIHEDVGATGGMIGDFDSDGDLDCADVDALIAQMIAGTNDPDFDLNEDGFVDVGDLNNWILDRKGTLFGDANLDFVVDVSDFNAWNGNRFTSNTSWCGGNFNGDNVTDVTDFNTWSANKFRFALRPTATPDTDPNPTDRPTILADVENPSSATDDAAPTPLQSPRDYTVARRTTTARWRSLVDSVWEAETATPQLATAPQPFSSINR